MEYNINNVQTVILKVIMFKIIMNVQMNVINLNINKILNIYNVFINVLIINHFQ